MLFMTMSRQQNWEYLVQALPGRDFEAPADENSVSEFTSRELLAEQVLNRAAEAGWRLVAIHPAVSGSPEPFSGYAVLERAVDSPR